MLKDVLLGFVLLATAGRSQLAANQPDAVTVTVQSDRDQGRLLITVTVANGLDRSIFTEDMKTACSIVHLERLVNDRWERIGDCLAERAAAVVEIGAGGDEMVTIDAGHAGATAGTYRAVVTYRLAGGPEGEEPERAESAAFELDACRRHKDLSSR
jgi:hypothetical protein